MSDEQGRRETVPYKGWSIVVERPTTGNVWTATIRPPAQSRARGPDIPAREESRDHVIAKAQEWIDDDILKTEGQQ